LENILDNLNLKNINGLIGNKDLLIANNLSKNTLNVLKIDYKNIKNIDYKQDNFYYDKKYLNYLINKGEPL